MKNEKCHYIYGKHQVLVVHGLSVTAVLTEKFAVFSRASLHFNAEPPRQNQEKMSNSSWGNMHTVCTVLDIKTPSMNW